jgi:hypothetical protein
VRQVFLVGQDVNDREASALILHKLDVAGSEA